MKYMLNLGLLAILVGLATTGCANSHYNVAIPGGPGHFTKLPRNPTEEEVKMAEKKDLELLKIRSQLECPEGGRDEALIAYRLAPDISKLLIVKMAEISVRNPYTVPVNIEDDEGIVVKNLCPHGRITLRSFLNPYGTDGQYKQVSWTATAVNASGTYATDTSPTFSLNAYDYEVRKHQQGGWTIRFQAWPSVF